MFHFTYVLRCSDGKRYIGSTDDLQRRLYEHQGGFVDATKHRRPVVLIYYEACLDRKSAQGRERYFKAGFGRVFLKKRIGE